MIIIDFSEIKNEKGNLSDFLKSKIQVSIAVNGDSLVLDAGEEKLPKRSVKILLKKFLHQRGLEEAYRVIQEKEVARIVKRKHRGKQNTGKKGTPPSPYDTLPYYFPNRPKLP